MNCIPTRLALPPLAALLLALPLAAQVQWLAPGSSTNSIRVNSGANRLCRVISGANTYAGTILNEPACSYIVNGAVQSINSGYTVADGLAKWEPSGLPNPTDLGLLNGLPTRVCRAKVNGFFLAGYTSTSLPVTCQIASPTGYQSVAPYELLYDFTTTDEFQIRNQELCLASRSGQSPAVQLRTCDNGAGDQWRIQTVSGGAIRLESVSQIGMCLHRDPTTNAATLNSCASATALRQGSFTDTTYRFYDPLGFSLFLGRAEGRTSRAPLSFRSSTGTPAEGFEVLTLTEASRRFSVTSYNIMMLPSIVFPYLQQMSRATMIPDALDRLGILSDVITFQEGFQNSSRLALLERLRTQYGYTYFTGVPDHSPEVYDKLDFLASIATNGGMFIASRWPIERIAFWRFSAKSQDGLLDTTGADAAAAKGVTYARILKFNRRYHVFTTHLQAGPPEDEAAVRQAQLREMKQFADFQLAGASPDDGVIFSGDFNISMEADVGNYYYLTDALQADFIDAPRPIGTSTGAVAQRWTVDPNLNDITRKRGGGFEWLDYAFIARRSARPTRADYQVYQPENNFPYIMEIKNTAELPWSQDPFFTQDVSDHGALHARFTFAPAANQVSPADLVTLELRTLQFENSNPIDDGQLLVGGGAVSTPQTITLERNKPVELEAFTYLPGSTGYRFAFDRWDNAATNKFTYTPLNNTDRITATYRRQVQLKVNSNPPDAGIITGDGYFSENVGEFPVTATPKPGFAFQSFSAPYSSTQSTIYVRAPREPLTFTANFVATGTPRLSLVPYGPRTYSSANTIVNVPLRMSNSGSGGAVNARISAVRNIVVTSGAGLVQYNGTPITGFGAIAAGATSNAASDVPFIWPATALRIRADFVLVTDTGYTTTVTLNLNR
ncbi:MAG: endonuclease/exonuclease/phosphatase family protein [Acidobacteria bacterium]|nr:endonuclease/exonuclease/phosphatase family protein [Acidobacteriota bacterium]